MVSREFLKSPFSQIVKIKLISSLVATSGNIDFEFTEKSQYFIGKHVIKIVCPNLILNRAIALPREIIHIMNRSGNILI